MYDEGPALERSRMILFYYFMQIQSVVIQRLYHYFVFYYDEIMADDSHWAGIKKRFNNKTEAEIRSKPGNNGKSSKVYVDAVALTASLVWLFCTFPVFAA